MDVQCYSAYGTEEPQHSELQLDGCYSPLKDPRVSQLASSCLNLPTASGSFLPLRYQIYLRPLTISLLYTVLRFLTGMSKCTKQRWCSEYLRT